MMDAAALLLRAAAAAEAVGVGGRAVLPVGRIVAADPGRWNTLPYQREPMDCLTDRASCTSP
jgi:hypothetical protein